MANTLYEVDPISRIEGHLGVKVSVSGGSIVEANAHGNLWRGFENFLVGRRANDAITFTQRICGVCPVPHGTAATNAADSVMGISTGYATFSNTSTGGSVSAGYGIPEAGLLVRNMVLGCEFLMSSITHFYHLAAQSYVQGPAIPPWTPYFDDSQYHPALLNKKPGSGGVVRAIPTVDTNGVPADLWSAVIKQYVKALRIRRLVFEASAMFAGRAPMMSMSIAGGTTNNFRSKAEFDAKCTTFFNLVSEVGEFVIREYIPLAFSLGALYTTFDNSGNGGSNYGAGCKNFLAWGGFPDINASGTFKVKGGYQIFGSPTVNLGVDYATASATGAGSAQAAIKANLKEFIARSRYADSTGDFGGNKYAYPGDVTRTEPMRNDVDGSGSYSWLKAPRWNGYPMEVGPFARTVINGEYLVDRTSLLLDPTGAGASFPTNPTWPQAYGWLYYNAAGSGVDTNVLHPDLVAGLNSSTNPTDGVGGQGPLLSTVVGWLTGLKGGYSTMDRLRARAIESFHVVTWLIGLPSKTGSTAHGVSFSQTNGWLGQLQALGASGVPTFSKSVLVPPTGKVSGFGLVEAPRGALGHFITADAGKIVAYQCVVPTTWNGSPKDGSDTGRTDGSDAAGNNAATTKRGPMEQAMIGVPFNASAVVHAKGGDRLSGVEVLRVAQSFDPCIACAVH